MSPATLIENTYADFHDARTGLRGVFLLGGLASASWVPLVPFAKTAFGLDNGGVGLILLMSGIGSVCAMPVSATTMVRYGSKTMMAAGAAVTAILLPLLLLAPSPAMLGALLFAFGLTRSGQMSAANANAVVVERLGGRAVMSSFHGCFSLGGLIGSVLITLLLKSGLSAETCLVVLGVVFAGGSLASIPPLLPKSYDQQRSGPLFAVPKGAAWLLGFFCFVSFLGEGSVIGWSSELLQKCRGFDASDAGMAFAGFSVAMAFTRFSGDALVNRYGHVPTLLAGATLAALGIALATLVPLGVVGVVGFAVMGLGAGNIVPLVYNAAGRLPGLPPTVSIPGVTSFSTVASLSGPALIGFLADAITLPYALLCIGGLYLLVALGARAVR